jgi:hypothetical protein
MVPTAGGTRCDMDRMGSVPGDSMQNRVEGRERERNGNERYHMKFLMISISIGKPAINDFIS